MRFVFLGDYIDRGPDSRSVVHRLIELQEELPDAVICLKGNHEQMLEHAERDAVQLFNWLANGGNTTLNSYRQRFFVHAGVDPFAPLNRQRDEVLLWVRDEFSEDIDTGRLIVHGHTPLLSGKPELRRWRLNIDTAAFAGGPLTAAMFTNEQVTPIAFLTDSGAITPVPS